MSCAICDELSRDTNRAAPHVIRICTECGDEYPVVERGEHGIGIKVEKGERFIIPREFLKLSANPLKSSSHFTHSGIEWFAEMVFAVDIAKKEIREDFS